MAAGEGADPCVSQSAYRPVNCTASALVSSLDFCGQHLWCIFSVEGLHSMAAQLCGFAARAAVRPPQCQAHPPCSCFQPRLGRRCATAFTSAPRRHLVATRAKYQDELEQELEGVHAARPFRHGRAGLCVSFTCIISKISWPIFLVNAKT